MQPATWESTGRPFTADWKNMVFNRFFLQILLRILLITGAMIGFSAIFLREDLFFTQLFLGLFILILLIELSRFVSKTNYDLTRFLDSIKDSDFSVHFTRSHNTRSFKALHSSFNHLSEALRELETENQAQLHFLNELVNQIKFGIITFRENGNIRLINNQACLLLELPRISNWKNLQNPNTDFLQRLLEMPESKNQLIETRIGQQTRYFSVTITSVMIRDTRYRIVSFQDIRAEIVHKEIEAWHKLIRILTHEVMNSVTPLVSLTETIRLLLSDTDQELKDVKHLTNETLQDIHEAVSTIRDRSQGILQFITNYRKVTRIPLPDLQEVAARDLVDGVINLLKPEIAEAGIALDLTIGNDVIIADKNLIGQVLINLVRNAMEALDEAEDGRITITSQLSGDYFRINISDNGPGIPPNKIDRVWVPFYTTKPEGSGIGLSLSRQIMNLHGGYIELSSIPHEETVFSLMFRVM